MERNWFRRLALRNVTGQAVTTKGKAKTLGKSLLTGGVLGGLFSTGNPHNTNLISSSPTLTVSSSEVSYT